MTTRKSQRSPEDIMFDLIGQYPGGHEAIAQRLNVSVKTLYKWLSTSLTLTVFSQIYNMLEEAHIDPSEALQAVNFRHDHIAVAIDDLEEADDDKIHKTFAELMARIGSMAGSLASLDDEEANTKHFEKTEVEARQSFARMAALWGMLRKRFERKANKPRKPLFSFVNRSTRHSDQPVAESVQQ